jgi:hypothetical protein
MKTTREAPVGSCIPLSFHRAGRAASSSDRGTVSKSCFIQTASCEHQMKSANVDAIFQDSYLAARDMHQTRFLSELAGKVFGTGESVPRFDAEEWRSSRLGPQSEFSKSLPGNFHRRTSGRTDHFHQCCLTEGDRYVQVRQFVTQPMAAQEPLCQVPVSPDGTNIG